MPNHSQNPYRHCYSKQTCKQKKSVTQDASYIHDQYSQACEDLGEFMGSNGLGEYYQSRRLSLPP